MPLRAVHPEVEHPARPEAGQAAQEAASEVAQPSAAFAQDLFAAQAVALPAVLPAAVAGSVCPVVSREPSADTSFPAYRMQVAVAHYWGDLPVVLRADQQADPLEALPEFRWPVVSQAHCKLLLLEALPADPLEVQQVGLRAVLPVHPEAVPGDDHHPAYPESARHPT